MKDVKKSKAIFSPCYLNINFHLRLFFSVLAKSSCNKNKIKFCSKLKFLFLNKEGDPTLQNRIPF